MTRHTFIEGMGLGILAGAAIGLCVAAKQPDAMRSMRRAAHRATRKLEHLKDDLASSLEL